MQRFVELSSEAMPDGNIKQVLMTPTGKITRIFDPITKKIVNQRSTPRVAALEEEPTPEAPVIPDLTNMKLYEIARVIKGNWKKPYFGSVPYLDAMKQLKDLNDKYGYDSASSIVAYFLGNATTWKGDVARAVKRELNNRLNRYYRRK